MEHQNRHSGWPADTALALVRRWVLAMAMGVLPCMYAQAATPQAHTVIGNQAAASYVDAAGNSRTVTSNVVKTTVSQIGAYTLSNDNARAGAFGTVVYMPHTLTNLGNGSDTFMVTVAEPGAGSIFSAIAVYPDANGNGVPSSSDPLCSSAGVSCATTGFSQMIAGNGGSFSFIVAYTIQPNGNLVTQASGHAIVRAVPDPQTSFHATYSPAERSRTDTVGLTLGASFNLTTAIAAPAVPPSSGAWPEAISMGRVSAPGCPVVWSSTVVSSNPACTYTVYTLRYTNTGNARAPLSLQDALPPGLAYVRGSAVWSSLSGTALEDRPDSAPQGVGANTITFSFNELDNTLRATIAGVNPNSAGTLSFVVLVRDSALPGQVSTGNKAVYSSTHCDATQTRIDPNNCAGQDPATGIRLQLETNIAPFIVKPTYGVVVASEASQLSDPTSPPPPEGVNLVVVPTVNAGNAVQFRSVITNTGSVVDSFNLSAASPSGTRWLPSGTVYTFLREDGLSPFTDTNQDGIVDTGPVPAGGSIEVILSVQWPVIPGMGTGPYETMLTATSVGSGAEVNPNGRDSIWHRVNAMLGSMVDLTGTAAGNQSLVDNNGQVESRSCAVTGGCDFGPGPSVQPTATRAATQATPTAFDVYIRNNDGVDNSYVVSASLPTGWQVKFVDGATPSCSADAIAQPIGVGVGAQRRIVACVFAPADAAVGTYTFRVNAVSSRAASTGTSVSDGLMYAVQVMPPVRTELKLLPALGNSPVAAGGVVDFAVKLANTGTTSCALAPGGFDVTVTLDASATQAGWRVGAYAERADHAGAMIISPLGAPRGSAPGNLSDSTLGVSPFRVGDELSLRIRLFAPANAAAYSSVNVQLRIEDVSSAACPSLTGVYTAQVRSEHVSVHKSQVLDPTCSGSDQLLQQLTTASLEAAPGQCLIYQVRLINEGSAVVSNVVLSDGIPAYTTYTPIAGSQPSVQCDASQLTGPRVRLEQNLEGIDVRSVWCGSEENSLAPAGTMTLRFSVQVDN